MSAKTLVTAQPSPRRAFTLIELLVVMAIIAVLLACLGLTAPFEIAWHLLLGWIYFLGTVLPKVRWSGAGFATAAACGLLTLAGFHRLGRILASRLPLDVTGVPRTWKLRWTLQAGLLIFLLFVSGTALVGAGHQCGWMLSDPMLFVEDGRGGAARSQSRNNLKQLGLAAWNEADTTQAFPGDIANTQSHRLEHGWATAMLPYLDQAALYQQIDFSQAWNADANRAVFQTEILTFYHPAVLRKQPESKQTATAWPTMHYSANSHVISPGNHFNWDGIQDGTANTLLYGEINTAFPAWGAPFNARDPLTGLNDPAGFGSPGVAIVQFCLADGSVKGISDNIDQDVLKALATPNGGDLVGEF